MDGQDWSHWEANWRILGTQATQHIRADVRGSVLIFPQKAGELVSCSRIYSGAERTGLSYRIHYPCSASISSPHAGFFVVARGRLVCSSNPSRSTSEQYLRSPRASTHSPRSPAAFTSSAYSTSHSRSSSDDPYRLLAALPALGDLGALQPDSRHETLLIEEKCVYSFPGR